MSKPRLQIIIISQEKQLISTEAEYVTAPAASGEVTILPGHIPLFSKLQEGVLRYGIGEQEQFFLISKGFLDMGPDNVLTVLVDAAVDARSISLEKAQAAVHAAEETMSKTEDQRELMMAEASLRRALLEIRVAQKTKQGSKI